MPPHTPGCFDLRPGTSTRAPPRPAHARAFPRSNALDALARHVPRASMRARGRRARQNRARDGIIIIGYSIIIIIIIAQVFRGRTGAHRAGIVVASRVRGVELPAAHDHTHAGAVADDDARWDREMARGRRRVDRERGRARGCRDG